MQCPNCGKQTKNTDKCDYCNFVIDNDSLKQKHKRDVPQINARDLCPPPRRVPAFLVLRSFSILKTIVITTAIISAYLIAKNSNFWGFPQLYLEYSLYSFLVVVAILSVGCAIRKIHLLKNGIAASAEVVKAVPYGKPYTSSNMGQLAGHDSTKVIYKRWDSESIAPGAPKFKHELRLTGSNGTTHNFYWKGFEYTGEYYLFDPMKPNKNIRMSRYWDNITPKETNWQAWPEDIKDFLIWFSILSAMCLTVLAFLVGLIP